MRCQIGIDEAGRGALIGPMVVAGIKVDADGLRLLEEMGVRDSKRLSPSVRERLYDEIVTVVDGHEERIYSARQVDANSLTTLELRGIVSILNAFGPLETGKVVIDCIGKRSSATLLTGAEGSGDDTSYCYQAKRIQAFQLHW